MKNLILVVFTLSLSLSVFAEVKVGIVNIQKIITTIKEGKSVNSTLEKSFKSKQKQIKAQEEKIKKLQTKFQKQSAVFTAEVKAKKGMEIQQQVQSVRQQMAKFQKEIQKEEANLKKPLLEKLKPVIDAVSKEAKVDLTFEISSSPVVYAASKTDLTDKVIKAYDKKYSK
jgi:outer membrane protein